MNVRWRWNYMNIEYRLYPYPVLTYFSDDYVNSSFTSNLKVGRKGDEIIFHLTANTDDEKLLNLIEEEYAEFVFHIEFYFLQNYNKIKTWI